MTHFQQVGYIKSQRTEDKLRKFLIHSFIHFICSTKIKTVALQIENEQDRKAHIYALTAALMLMLHLMNG